MSISRTSFNKQPPFPLTCSSVTQPIVTKTSVMASTHAAPAGFRVRDATLDDVHSLTDLWYTSFNPSHKFWDIMTPDDVISRQWWDDTWTMGLKAGHEVLRTFIVEDMSNGNKPVAFSRWNVPQSDGRQDIPLPEYPAHWDMELTDAFWNVLEFVGVDQDYQEKGLGFTLVNWGCQQADAAGLEVYLDATLKGLAFYKRHFGFQDRKVLAIPPRSQTFGTYELMAVVRPAKRIQLLHDLKHGAATQTVTEIVHTTV